MLWDQAKFAYLRLRLRLTISLQQLVPRRIRCITNLQLAILVIAAV